MGIFEGIGMIVAVIVLGLIFPRVCFVVLACVFLKSVLGYDIFPEFGAGKFWEVFVGGVMGFTGIVMLVIDILILKTVRDNL
ncbi:hypothetical protein A3C73_01590 [Candidatus Giovannonibacteria bacterium RIFCSPHIGHO2_02_FULL_44_11]|nr:MAG: hypothetical protein A3C73_01590 [Candidatus Giovannonibacteria bacterium RIFCSPHIGHO2_02_FULL_44_11]